MSGKKTIWTRNFILICLAGLATNACMRMLDSNLASFASAAWDSKSLGGALTSVFNVGSIVMAFFSGRLVDTKGRRRCLIFAALLFAAPTVAMGLLQTPAVALAARLVQGVAKGVVTVAMAAIVSDITPRERMNEGMGMFNLGSTISFAFGPMLGLALVDGGGYGVMFLVCAACYASAALFGAGINYEGDRSGAAPAREAGSSGEYKGIWKLIEKNALLPSLNHTIFFGGYACILVFVTVYAQEILKLDSTRISLFYTVAAVVMLAVRLATSKLGDVFGPLSMIVPGHLAIAGSLLCLAFFAQNSYAAFLAAGGLYGAGNAVVMPAFNAVAVVDSPEDRNGTANATFYFMMDFGILFASAGFGALIDAAADIAAGYRQMYLISVGITVLSMVMAVVLFNNKARARRLARAQGRAGHEMR